MSMLSTAFARRGVAAAVTRGSLRWMSAVDSAASAAAARRQLLQAKRIMVKLGSVVVTRSNGAGLALGRMANIVEQVCHLQAAGREMLVVSSGAVATGRQVLANQRALNLAARAGASAGEPLPIPSRPIAVLPATGEVPSSWSGPECAAVGQSALMSLYDAMFKSYRMTCGQVLVSVPDLLFAKPRQTTCATIDKLVRMRIVPIINENDVVQCEPTQGDGSVNLPVGDNDSIGVVLARELKCDLLLLLSNVSGVYTGDPGLPDSRLLSVITPDMIESGVVKYAAGSTSGRGGMEAKVRSALFGVQNGVPVVIANGLEWRSILDIIEGKPVGTLFTK